MFEDRIQAGDLLAQKLSSLKMPFSAVLAIPRGGVVVGRVIADRFQKPLGVVNAKKIPTPGQPELAAGAEIIKDRGFGTTPNVKNKNVTLVDDGIATGATVETAINYLKEKGAAKIILAVPVAPPEAVERLSKLVDRLVVLETPDDLMAVGQFYRDFPQVSDEEVLQLLHEANNRARKSRREI